MFFFNININNPFYLFNNKIDKEGCDNKVGSKFTPKYIVIHNTANSAPSINEVKYLHNNTSSTSYHFAVDDENIYQAIPTNYNAWHVGNRNITLLLLVLN